MVGNFPDGESVLMLVAARSRHIASTKWGSKPYMNMGRLYALEQKGGGHRSEDERITCTILPGGCSPEPRQKCENTGW